MSDEPAASQRAARAQELFPILTAADLSASLRFYRDLLGGEVTYRFPATGDPAYVGLRFGIAELGIGQREEPGPTANDRVSVWVYVGDCAAAVAELRAAGVTVVAEPAAQPWGERTAVVLDPDANRVIVADRG